MQENKNCYWDKNQQQVTIVPTHTIVHPCIEIMVVKYFQDIPRSVFNINQSRQALQIRTIRLTESDNDFIIVGIL